jgi:hypothetical protein
MTTENTETQAGTQTANHAAAAQKPRSAKKATNAKKAAKAPKEAHKKADPAKAESARQGSKTETIFDLLRRAKGATLPEIMPYASQCTSLA